MNKYEKLCQDSKLGLKTYQNVQAALRAFEKLRSVISSNDYCVVSALFHTAVIRYAKPFLNTDSGAGVIKYPIKHLKQIDGFSTDLHNHLLHLRNRLVAHDDFEEIEPKLLVFGLTITGTDHLIPTSIGVANKCISHPAAPAFFDDAIRHISSTLTGVSVKLESDLQSLRSIAIEDPAQANESAKYKNNYGLADVPATGGPMIPPDFMSDSWLTVREPDFSYLKNGYFYEEVRLRKDFYGPETINLPNGEQIVIAPLEK